MIAFDFDYYRPATLDDAVDAFLHAKSKGGDALYYAGGSEIISMSRVGSIEPSAVIDIKNIPECSDLIIDKKHLNIGSVCTLYQISESNLFPLMKLSCGRIADHTNQCRITLGGNLCGSIIYRETSLPLLLSDAHITLYGKDGKRKVPFDSVFNGRMQLSSTEMIVKIHIPIWALSAPYFHIKKTANEKIDYPLISIAAIIKGDYIRIAFSGVCSFPFRSKKIEKVLNDRSNSIKNRARRAISLLPDEVHSDGESSGEYRLFVLENTLLEILKRWENGRI